MKDLKFALITLNDNDDVLNTQKLEIKWDGRLDEAASKYQYLTIECAISDMLSTAIKKAICPELIEKLIMNKEK